MFINVFNPHKSSTLNRLTPAPSSMPFISNFDFSYPKCHYAYNNAIDWHNYWLELGDELYGTYMFNRVDMKRAAYPDWWSEILNNAPRRPVEESAK